ncbi:MAG TPA: hypothetical protein VNQ90_18925 [Chthoniobacteraceae bacterium]|nr:hypothetical protein [Chthoniobacteraceae bacterium]
MSSSLFELTGHLIDAIKINRMVRREREGRPFWVKERRIWSGAVIGAANAFFHFAGNPVVVHAQSGEWQQCEVSCYRLLHGGEGFEVFAQAPATVWAEQLPGVPLDHHAFGGTLTLEMVRAAGRELKRGHALRDPVTGSLWSHGDPHLGNFIYDACEGRARLIDFEVHHRHEMSEAECHADDLLVVLLDLLGHGEEVGWLEAIPSFLAAYWSEGVAPAAGLRELLRERVGEPKGLSRLWWGIRTGYLGRAELCRRLATLREMLAAEPVVPAPVSRRQPVRAKGVPLETAVARALP